MHKVFTGEIASGEAIVRGDDHKHLSRVLRVKTGETLTVNDLMGHDFEGIVKDVLKDHTVISIISEIEGTNESPVSITLYQGMPKAGKMDLIVQKATELGAVSIVPVITARVESASKGEYRKLDRLRRIALEASKQSKRTIIPEVAEPRELAEIADALGRHDLIVVPYENAEGYGINMLRKEIQEADDIAVVIGPEGGFEAEEIRLLDELGAKTVTLGKRILRTETAGMAAIAMLQMAYGDMGGD
jgi:16S rRNA (uracil1498-N3)-methyltransferase